MARGRHVHVGGGARQLERALRGDDDSADEEEDSASSLPAATGNKNSNKNTNNALAHAPAAAQLWARVRATQHRLSPQPAQLDREIDLMRAMCFAPGPAWATTDALGIGSVLEASAELIDLSAHGDLASEPTLLGFIHALLADAHRSIDAFAASDDLSRPLEARLPFRELGLAIGLRGIAPMRACVARHPDHFGSLASNNALRTRLEAIARLEPLAEHIEQTWLDPAAQRASTWSDPREINSVMLAASRCAADGVRAPVHAPAPAPAPAHAPSSVSLASARASSRAAPASS
jgi:hypothetical protein